MASTNPFANELKIISDQLAEVLKNQATILANQTTTINTQNNEFPKISDILGRLSHIEEAAALAKHSKVKLGKRAPRIDPRTLQLGKYMKALPAPAASVDLTGGIINWGMMLNDTLGDCTIAACGHAVQSLTKLAKGTELTYTDALILAYYEAWDGYVNGDPSTDNGGVELDVLHYWYKYGFGPRVNHQGADKLLCYADPNPANITEIKQAISLFGGVYIGLGLPITAQNQTIWSVVGDGKTGNSAPGSWGGHAVWCPKYDENYVTCVTWGGLTQMTWGFWQAYVDEAHALLAADFMEANNVAASGFDLSALQADLKLLV